MSLNLEHAENMAQPNPSKEIAAQLEAYKKAWQALKDEIARMKQKKLQKEDFHSYACYGATEIIMADIEMQLLAEEPKRRCFEGEN